HARCFDPHQRLPTPGSGSGQLDQFHHFRSADGFDPDGSHAAFTPLPERVVKRQQLAAPVLQLGAAAPVPPFEPGALPGIAIPVRVELPARPIELAPLALALIPPPVPVSGIALLVFEAWLGASG